MRKTMSNKSNYLAITLVLSLIILFSNTITIIGQIQVSRSLELDTNWADMINNRKAAIATLPATG